MARRLDNWLQSYMEWTLHSESPDKFHFWTGISTVAGALRRNTWIDMRAFKWIPNFYIILVAPAGVVAKSTSITLGHKLLRKVAGVKFGPTTATWQGLLEAFQDATELVNMGPGVPQMKVSALNLAISELGTFLRPDEDDYMSFLIDMWDGKEMPIEKRTRQDGSVIVENTWMNLIAATTPSWLQANMPQTLADGGLASRIIFVYADAKRKLVPFPDEMVPDAEYLGMEKALIADLTEIGKLRGQFTMTLESREWGRKWYNDLNTKIPIHLTHQRFGGYLARKQTHLMKLAIVLAAAKRDDLTITVQDLEEADKCLLMVESDMTRVFESIGLSDSGQKLNTIMSLLKTHKKIENSILWKSVLSHMSQKEYQEALMGGVTAGLLKVRKEADKTYVSLA